METNNLEFQAFSKIPRLSREVVITEKIDGTNVQILITEEGRIITGSRKRWITPEDDNFGFARWVEDNKDEILKLGAGRHFGEWWGSGIQRGYNLLKGEKRFSLFNVNRWALFNTEPKLIKTADVNVEKYQEVLPKCIGLVPVLYRGIFDTVKIEEVLEELKINGSQASKGFMNPEGIVIFHIAGNLMFKKTIEKDEVPKGKLN